MGTVIHDFKKGLRPRSESPWLVDGVDARGAMSALGAVELAGANFPVCERPVWINGFSPDDGHFMSPTNKALVRFHGVDHPVQLGIVGKGYTVIQTAEMAETFDMIAGESGAQFESVGIIDQGKAVLAQATLTDSIFLTDKNGDEDEIQPFLLFYAPHDGNHCAVLGFQGTRIVCKNTLEMALKQAKNQIKIKHTRNAVKRLKMAQDSIQAAHHYFHLFGERAQGLVDTAFDDGMVTELIERLYPAKQEGGELKVSTRTANIWEGIEGRIRTGTGLAGFQGTAWGAWQGVVEWIDYDRAVKGNQRLKSIVFGSGARLKVKALDLIDTITTEARAGA